MFSKLTVFAATLLAAATAVQAQCNTGAPQCCSSVTKAGDPSTSSLLALLGIVVQGANVPVGLDCSPITVIGAGTGSNCAQNPVCCEQFFEHGIAVGCVPVNVSL